MAESQLPTYEEAKRCPKCGQPGELGPIYPAPAVAKLARGTKIHVIYCRNSLCTWYNTAWQIQVNPDGSIPAPKDHRGEPKLYAGVKNHDTIADRIMQGLQAQLVAETSHKPDGTSHEIRNPYSA